MIKRYILPTLLVLLLAGGLLLTHFLVTDNTTEEPDSLQLSTKKANDDFTDLFRLTNSRGDALAAVTVTAVEEVTELIEKYEVTDTLYTKITATVDQDYTEQLSGSITILLLGNAERFPSREVLKAGNCYILRLEPWVHESGNVYLLNPLESTYLRIHNDMVLVRESASLPNYLPALTPEEFAKAFATYRTENPTTEDQLKAHYNEVVTTILAYDYDNKELAYRPDEDAVAKRLNLAKQLASK